MHKSMQAHVEARRDTQRGQHQDIILNCLSDLFLRRCLSLNLWLTLGVSERAAVPQICVPAPLGLRL